MTSLRTIWSFTLLALCLLPLRAEAATPTVVGADCQLSFVAPGANTDGTALTDLKEVRAYLRPAASASYDLNKYLPIPVGTTTTSCAAIGLKADGAWFTVLRAVDTSNNLSVPSAELALVRNTVPPNPPTAYQILISSETPMTILQVSPKPVAKGLKK
jgi:hypothetical protein